MLDGIAKDFGYALRSLRRAPMFTVAAVFSLALGIGGNTAIFSLIDQVMLRALPVRNPEELVIVKSPGPRNGSVTSDEQGSAGAWSYPMYKDLRDKTTSMSGLLARFAFDASIAFAGRTNRARGELVSGNYFELLGVQPALGRLLTPQDDVTPGGSFTVVLSHHFWTQQFNSSSDVLNEKIVLNGHPMTVAGVAAPGFFGVQKGFNPDVFVTMMMKSQMTPNWNGLDNHRDYWLNIMGRLQTNVTAEQAQAQMSAIYRPLLEAEADLQNFSGERRDRWIAKPIVLERGASGRQILSNDIRQPLLILMGMVSFVLLIACANVANLLVARATARERETAVRLAIGAPRSRLIRQCLIESLVLALGGALVGLVVANWTITGLLQIMPPDSSVRALTAALDARVLLFAFVLSCATGILFGLLPAFESTRSDVASGLKAGTASSSTSRHARIRKSLVIAQVAFTLLTLIGSGLFAKTLLKLQAVDVGMRTESVIRFRLAPDLNGYSSRQTGDFYSRLQDSLKTIPGVANVSMGKEPIFSDSDSGANVTIEGYKPTENEDMDLASNQIAPDYFSTLSIPLIRGREFAAGDALTSPKVCIINQATAERFFSGRDPIGYRIAFGAGNRVVPDMTVVGVVGNSKHSKVGEVQKRFIYTPYSQQQNLNQITFYVRSKVDADSLMPAIRGRVRDLDPALPIAEMKTLETQISESLYGERLMTILSIAFGVLSALLASFGIYGVMSYLVSKRTREIGIRIAVGAPLSLVRWMIVKEILGLAAAGVLVGLVLAVALGRTAQALLYETTGTDIQVSVFAIIGVGLLSLAAGYFPARRATRIDPVIALRNE